jgi:hypothetical protein
VCIVIEFVLYVNCEVYLRLLRASNVYKQQEQQLGNSLLFLLFDKTITATPRQLESLIRISQVGIFGVFILFSYFMCGLIKIILFLIPNLYLLTPIG